MVVLLCAFTTTAASAATDLAGVVLDASSTPIIGAHVYVYTAKPKFGVSSLCPSCYIDCGKHEPVDEKARFALKALDPTLLFDVLAVAPGYEAAFSRGVDPSCGGITIRLSLRPTGDADRLITGKVLDPDGNAVIGAIVEPSGYRFGDRIGYGNIPGVDKLSITGQKGEFALRIPDSAGKLDVRVIAKSFAPKIERLLEPGQVRRIGMEEGSTIVGRVTRSGRPIEGVRIGFVQRNRASSGYLGRAEIGTNEHGMFVMTNMAPDETYVVYAPMESLQDGVVEPIVLTTGTSDQAADVGELQIMPGRCISGAVIVPKGASIPPKTRILVSNGLAGDWRQVEIRQDGSFLINGVPVGPVRLSAHIPGLALSPPPASASGSRFDGALSLAGVGDLFDVRMVFERP